MNVLIFKMQYDMEELDNYTVNILSYSVFKMYKLIILDCVAVKVIFDIKTLYFGVKTHDIETLKYLKLLVFKLS